MCWFDIVLTYVFFICWDTNVMFILYFSHKPASWNFGNPATAKTRPQPSVKKSLPSLTKKRRTSSDRSQRSSQQSQSFRSTTPCCRSHEAMWSVLPPRFRTRCKSMRLCWQASLRTLSARPSQPSSRPQKIFSMLILLSSNLMPHSQAPSLVSLSR